MTDQNGKNFTTHADVIEAIEEGRDVKIELDNDRTFLTVDGEYREEFSGRNTHPRRLLIDLLKHLGVEVDFV